MDSETFLFNYAYRMWELCWICNVQMPKHKLAEINLFLSRVCVYYLKWNVIEWDHIYHKIIQKYGGCKGHKYGNKWHMFYHSLEWIERARWSPADMDDERVEQFNVHISKYLPIYACFKGHINLKRMMNKIWREFVLG